VGRREGKGLIKRAVSFFTRRSVYYVRLLEYCLSFFRKMIISMLCVAFFSSIG
jgi:hypothetical protein